MANRIDRHYVAGVDVSTRGIAIAWIEAPAVDDPTPSLIEHSWHPLAHYERKEDRPAAAWGIARRLFNDEDRVYVEQPFGQAILGIAEVERVIGGLLAACPYAQLLNVTNWKRLAGVPRPQARPRVRKGMSPDEWNALMDAYEKRTNLTAKEYVRVRSEELFPELQNEPRQDIHDAALIAVAGLRASLGLWTKENE